MTLMSRFLERICRNRPARVIHTGGEPYLYRIFLFNLWGWRGYLHHFVSADDERWLHDHPFDGLSIVLSGEYVEERLVYLSWPQMFLEARSVRWFNWISAHCFHRILAPCPGTWTLFLHGPKFKGWGFMQLLDDFAGCTYTNPHGNVGSTPWWRCAPTYGHLRSEHVTPAATPDQQSEISMHNEIERFDHLEKCAADYPRNHHE